MYDSQTGLYYNLTIDNRDPLFDPTVVPEIEIRTSLFSLFPSVSLLIANRQNFFVKEGFLSVGNELGLEISSSEKDEDSTKDILEDFILEAWNTTPSRPSIENAIGCTFVNKHAQDLITASPAAAYNSLKTSEAIQDIILNKVKFPSESVVQTTKNKGFWLKPANQSYAKFLRILKNRSITSDESQMVMWIDLSGNFNFKSLNSLIQAKPAQELDFTTEEIERYTPANIVFSHDGLRYDNTFVNSNYKEYVFDAVNGGELSEIKANKTKKLGRRTTDVFTKTTETFSRDQDILQGYSHSLLPTEYNRALYINSSLNFPFVIQFRIQHLQNNPLKPGNVIKIKFPSEDTDGEYDLTLSNDYLITDVVKSIKNGLYVTDVKAFSNSIFTTEIDKFFK